MIDYIDCVAPFGYMPEKLLLESTNPEEGVLSINNFYKKKINNLIFRKVKGHLRCQGSLTTYSHGHNAITLTHPEIVTGIEKLENEIGCRMDDWQIWRIELGVCIETELPASRYLPFFLSMPRKKRVIYEGETLYFNCNRERFKVYDKMKQMKADKTLPGITWFDKNLVRLELDIRYSITEIIGPLFIKDLKNPRQFASLIKFFLQRFDEIRVIEKICRGDTGTLTTKEARNLLFGQTIRIIGANQVGGMVESFRSCMKSSDFTSFRKQVEQIQDNAFQEEEGLMEEVKQKVYADCDRILATCM